MSFSTLADHPVHYTGQAESQRKVLLFTDNLCQVSFTAPLSFQVMMSLPIHNLNSDEEILNEFLQLSQPVRVWQEELINMIRSYIIKEEYMKAMQFFSHMIQSGLNAYEKKTVRTDQTPHRKARPTFVEYDTNLMPVVLDMDRWKRLLIALGFEIEEPDGYHKREDISIILGDCVVKSVLEGMLLLLKILQEIPWNHLNMLIRLSMDEAISLDTMLQSSQGPMINQKEAKNIYDKYPSEIKELGFQKANRCIVRVTPIHTNLTMAVKGLFGGTLHNGDVYI